MTFFYKRNLDYSTLLEGQLFLYERLYGEITLLERGTSSCAKNRF